ncbi:RNA polymerase III RPC4-domain-containing protein [Amanita rubescens]|nr:RNA polymerase III RPC4-domain-containing protein [Amanita rubescens]
MSDSSKAIGSLAKKQSEVTRQGTQKLKFVPTLPVRRKKEETKTESAPSVTAENAHDGKGRGRGRGMSRQVAEMTASGPFAMGPALSGKLAGRSMPRSDVALPTSASTSRNPPAMSTIPSLKKMDVDPAFGRVDRDEELYSEPDEGVEIIDLQNVRELDWMAPETLRKESRKKPIGKAEQAESELRIVNAIDLSEDEEEELKANFSQTSAHQDPSHRGEKLLFFQFPAPFSMFSPDTGFRTSDLTPVPSTKNVQDVKPGLLDSVTPATPSIGSGVIDGIIGQLETYRSGAVKFRLNNGILFDVNAAIQPTFFQQAVCLQHRDKRMIVIGDLHKRFVVSPDVDTLLTAMDEADRAPGPTVDGEEKLIKMDIP